MKKSITLGFCPIGKFVFSHEDALRKKGKLEKLLDASGVRWTGLDDVLPDGIVRRQEDVDPVVRHFRSVENRHPVPPTRTRVRLAWRRFLRDSRGGKQHGRAVISTRPHDPASG